MSAEFQVAAADKRLAEYLTAEQVADVLQVKSTKSVYRWAKRDPSMPMLKIGGTVRFPRERLMEWLRDREQGRTRIRSQVRMVGKTHSSPPLAQSCAEPCADQGRG